jgi:hypothetical protein
MIVTRHRDKAVTGIEDGRQLPVLRFVHFKAIRLRIANCLGHLPRNPLPLLGINYAIMARQVGRCDWLIPHLGQTVRKLLYYYISREKVPDK